jgi:valyl-tRNA synthetase
LQEDKHLLVTLARVDEEKLEIQEEIEPANEVVTLPLGEITAYLPMSGMVDVAQEQSRLRRELEEVNGQIERLHKLLEGPFSKKAPAEVVAKEREKLERYEAQRAELKARLS